MLPAALATAPRCQPRALRYWRRAAAPRSPGRPGLTRRPSDVQPGNVVPTRSHGADYRSRSISWVFALSKMSQARLRPIAPFRQPRGGAAKRFASEIATGVKRSVDVVQQLALAGLRDNLTAM